MHKYLQQTANTCCTLVGFVDSESGDNVLPLGNWRNNIECNVVLPLMREFKRISQLRGWKCFLANGLRLGEHTKKTKIKTKNDR